VTGPGTPTQPNTQPPNPRIARVVPRGPVPLAPAWRQPQLPGAIPNERVIWMKRQSRIYLIASAMPMVLILLGLVVLRLLLGNAIGPLGVLVLVVEVILLIRWLIVSLYPWFFTYLILTNERVIKSSGYFHKTNEQIVLKSVAQVYVERTNPLVMALGVGDVQIRPIGRPIDMPGLARPRDVADSILAAQEDANYGLPAAAPAGTPGAAAAAIPPVPLKRVQGSLDDLAKPAPMPAATPVSGRVFASFLQRRIPIRFIEGEQVIQVVYRHWIVLLRNEIIPLTVLTGSAVLAALLVRGGAPPSLPALLFALGLGASGIAGFLLYLNWADDVFVLTTHRVIDVDRLLFILNEYSNDAPYARVQDVRVQRPFFGMIFGYGSISVETSGRRNTLQMSNIPHAGRVMDNIFRQINLLRERDAVAATNRQKKENQKWFSTLFNDAIARVPDVRGMPLLDAATVLRQVDLKMVISGERRVPGVAAGTVVDQEPSGGSAEIAEGEVRVILSSQTVMAKP
jgi:PASTA domain/Bacterial PH domain